MTDSVERLRKLFPDEDGGADIAGIAADEIELLRSIREAQGRTIRALQAGARPLNVDAGV